MFKYTKYGYQIADGIEKLVLSLPVENILNSEGNILTICGFGIIFRADTGDGLSNKGKEFKLSTIFETQIADQEPNSVLGDGYIDLIYDSTSYVIYIESGIDPSRKQIPLARDSTNVEFLFKKFNGGKFSSAIPYENQHDVILNNLELNKHLNVPFPNYEALIANSFINKKSGKLYRLDPDPEQLEHISLVQQGMVNNGTFGALTNQDAKTAMLVAMTTKQDKVNTIEEFALT